ncbi:MAG: Crp/Fnr family transcriptional regulator [Bacteroidetes bacterium]|nr:Crp/Fnr family transcriptional regulator [Bacteroidota bacterium]
MKQGFTNSCTVRYDSIDCFQKLTDEELFLLENNKVEVVYKKGENLCKQKTYTSHIMYICDGLVKIYMEDDINSLTLKILPSGNMIGLSSLLDGSNIFQYSAYAYQNTKVRLIDIGIFKQLIRQNAEFANEIINLLCENSIQIYARFFCFTQKQAYGRMADTFLCLACRIYKNKDFEINISRKELADLAGISTESVIRILKKFKEEKLISVQGKKYKILDEFKLQQISNHG